MVTVKSEVTLREVTEDTVRSVCELAVKEEQNSYVAPNAISIAEAYFSKDAWFRAIYADETPVGFAMLEVQPKKAEYYLWRFMVDAQHQKSGFGRRAMVLLIEHVRTMPNAIEFLTSVVPGDDCPQGFYEGLGFQLTGEWDNGEAIMRLVL